MKNPIDQKRNDGLALVACFSLLVYAAGLLTAIPIHQYFVQRAINSCSIANDVSIAKCEAVIRAIQDLSPEEAEILAPLFEEN